MNQQGLEGGNAGYVVGCTLPWLQDVAPVDAWGRWGVNTRDVVVLDAENRVHGVYSLQVNDLGTAAVYEALKALILDAGTP